MGWTHNNITLTFRRDPVPNPHLKNWPKWLATAKNRPDGSSWPIQNHQPSDRFASESWYSRRDFRFSISVSWSRTKSWQELRAALELAHFKWQMSSFFWPQSSSTGLVNPGLTLLHKSDRGHVGILAGFCTCHYISLRWLMGESTGNQRSCIKGLLCELSLSLNSDSNPTLRMWGPTLMKQSLQVSYSAGKLSSESCACLAWASSCAWVTTAGNLQITSDCYSKVLHEISIQVSTKSAHDTVATTSPLHYGISCLKPWIPSLDCSKCSWWTARACSKACSASRFFAASLVNGRKDLSLRGYLMLPLYGINMWEKDGQRTLKRTLIPYRPYRGNPLHRLTWVTPPIIYGINIWD